MNASSIGHRDAEAEPARALAPRVVRLRERERRAPVGEDQLAPDVLVEILEHPAVVEGLIQPPDDLEQQLLGRLRPGDVEEHGHDRVLADLRPQVFERAEDHGGLADTAEAGEQEGAAVGVQDPLDEREHDLLVAEQREPLLLGGGGVVDIPERWAHRQAHGRRAAPRLGEAVGARLQAQAVPVRRRRRDRERRCGRRSRAAREPQPW